MVGWRRRGGANDKEAGKSGEEGRMVLKAGFNQQQAVGNEITILPLSDRCHVKLCTERHAEDDRHPRQANSLVCEYSYKCKNS